MTTTTTTWATVTVDAIDMTAAACTLFDELGWERSRELAEALLDLTDEPEYDDVDDDDLYDDDLDEDEAPLTDDWGECRRCGQTVPFYEGYMVHADVWPPPYEGVLHVACLEAEIGRQLTPDDFTDCALNLFPLLEPAQHSAPPDADSRLLLAQRISGLEDPWITRDAYEDRRAAAWQRFKAVAE